MREGQGRRWGEGREARRWSSRSPAETLDAVCMGNADARVGHEGELGVGGGSGEVGHGGSGGGGVEFWQPTGGKDRVSATPRALLLIYRRAFVGAA